MSSMLKGAAVLWRLVRVRDRSGKSVTAIAAPQAAPSNPDRHFHQTVAKAFDKEFGPL